MGISLNQWRSSIGLFKQKVIFSSKIKCSTGCNIRLACIIAVLLLIGGVEMNPGPTVAELAKKFEEFVASYQSMRDQFETTVPALSNKLDQIFAELSTIIHCTNETLKQQNMRIIALEQKLSINNFEHSNIMNPAISNQGNSSVQYKSGATNETIERVVKNVIDKNSRKNNAIIFNLPDTNSFIEDKRRLSILFSDLNLDEKIIENISRIGRPSAKSRPLRVQLLSERYRNILLDAAYKLKSMSRAWPKIGISPDRTQTEIEHHRNIMQEFRRRRSQGEQIRLDGEKIVSLNANPLKPTSQNRPTSVNNPSTDSTGQFSSPLRVALPPLSSQQHASTLSTTAKVFCPVTRSTVASSE